MKGQFFFATAFFIELLLCSGVFCLPFTVPCDSNMIRTCVNNMRKFVKIETCYSRKCSEYCRKAVMAMEEECDCNWLSNGICYNYIHCWYNNIDGWCKANPTATATNWGDTCAWYGQDALTPNFPLNEYLKIMIGNSNNCNSSWASHCNKNACAGKPVTCNCSKYF